MKVIRDSRVFHRLQKNPTLEELVSCIEEYQLDVTQFFMTDFSHVERKPRGVYFYDGGIPRQSFVVREKV